MLLDLLESLEGCLVGAVGAAWRKLRVSQRGCRPRPDLLGRLEVPVLVQAALGGLLIVDEDAVRVVRHEVQRVHMRQLVRLAGGRLLRLQGFALPVGQDGVHLRTMTKGSCVKMLKRLDWVWEFPALTC